MKPSTIKNLAPYRSNAKTVKTMIMKVRQRVASGVFTWEDFFSMTANEIKILLFPLAEGAEIGTVHFKLKLEQDSK